MSIVLTVNREHYILHDDESIARVRDDIEAAVHAGGRMVLVADRSDGPEVLITPVTAVRIDTVDVEADDPGSAPEFVDFDSY
jgi:hypothetical protein